MTDVQPSPAPPPLAVYEVYRARFQVVEWKEGAIFRTKSLGTGWFPESEVEANRPRDTSIIYVAASDEFARTQMTIRLKKEARD
jgi:hypothetical protein